jgi:sugar phosphate isomerase/epimerase
MIDVALQLYTVRDRTASDMAGAIAALAGIGYRYVEPAGYGNLTASEFADALDANGIQAISAHVGIDRLIDERPVVIEEMQRLGCKHIIIPWLTPERRTSEFTGQLITYMNAWGPEFRDHGIRLGYHNHEFEFEPQNGTTMFERIRNETDSELVSLQIDLGWAAFAGADPVQLIRENPGRVPLLHAKDLSADGGSATSGEGVLPWSDIIAAAREAGTDYLIVENDKPEDSLADVRQAKANLEALLAAS